MKHNHSKNHLQTESKKTNTTNSMVYPASEDIYTKSKKEADINPKDTSTIKQLKETYNEAYSKIKMLMKIFLS